MAIKKHEEIRLNVKPIFLTLYHEYVFEGPCRFGEGIQLEKEFDLHMAAEKFKGWYAQLQAAMPENVVNLLEPVKVERDENFLTKDEMIDKLAEGIAKVCRAFYPRPITLRTSDFKTNEYRDMKGGADYEPNEDNPMIGWRGCSRYVSDSYREAFMCELKAIKKVRDEMGLKNLNMMLPFVRTIEEVEDITEMMKSVGLRRGKDFKLYFMAEIPVNIFMADKFCEYCDWFSIGSNDLTQLVMGSDRDSDILGHMGYFDERNEGVKRAIAQLIKVAHEHGKHVSICGQGPSVYPEFTEFLVEQGIDCISLNPDTFAKTKRIIASAEQRVILRDLRNLRMRLLE